MTTEAAQAAAAAEGGEGTAVEESQVVDTSVDAGSEGEQGQGSQEGTSGDFLSVSDEAIMNANSPEEYAALLDKAAQNKAKADEAKAEAAEPVEGKEEADKEAGTADEGADSAAEDKAKDAESKNEGDESNKEEDKSKEDKSNSVVDYEAEYKRLLAPFKANGHEITVKSVDDAINLMQQGANYNKKMAALKPNLKLMKMLESSGFLNEEKVGFLIDLGKKDPAAINKLIKESGIEPMELDAEKASGYKQTTFAPTDAEMDLDTVLDELSSTPTYTRTLNVVGTQWDAASKEVVQKQPAILKVINDHMQRGIYDRIEKEVQSERIFGRLSGLSDIEAYRQVGDAMQARGEFGAVAAPQAKPAKEPKVVTPTPKKVDDDKLKEKRRAASSTKPVASAPVNADFNPLALSDEEFAKYANAIR